MAILTFSVDEVAGMIAARDDRHEPSHVLVVGAQHREAHVLLEQLARKLGSRVVKFRRTLGNARLTLRHGVAVTAGIPQPLRGRVAHLLVLCPTLSDRGIYEVLPSTRGTGGTAVKVDWPASSVADQPRTDVVDADPADQAPAAAGEAATPENPASPV